MADKSRSGIVPPLVWLIVLHVLVLVGLKIHETQDIAQRLIPVNLLVTMGMLFYYQKHWNMRIIVFCFGLFWLMFLVEAIGVQTGMVFGTFHYGKSLGPRLFGVPLAVGLLWLVLVYCAGIMVKNLKYNMWVKAAIGAGMLVMFDVLLEQVATRFGMWEWSRNRIPLVNYAAWFVLSYPLLLLLINLKAKLRNDLAPYAFCVVAGFFVVANLF